MKKCKVRGILIINSINKNTRSSTKKNYDKDKLSNILKTIKTHKDVDIRQMSNKITSLIRDSLYL